MDTKKLNKTTLREYIREQIENHSREETFNKVLNSDIGITLPESDIYTYCQKLHRNENDFWEGDIGERIENFSQYKLLEMPIVKIDIDEWELDDDMVDKYIEKYNKNGKYPPIVLGDEYFSKYTIIDGNHRANALIQLGFKTIKSWVGVK